MKIVLTVPATLCMQITEQANGLYSVYSETGAHSMADEKLVAYDCTEDEAYKVARNGTENADELHASQLAYIEAGGNIGKGD